MAVNREGTVAADPWLLRLLVAAALLQALFLSASVGGIFVLWMATHSDLVHDVLIVANALAAATLRIAFHIFTLS